MPPYLESAWEHIGAPNNGLQHGDQPWAEKGCRFIAFEDFGTTGLEGSPADAFRPPAGGKNNFYHFFRAEGQSDKGESERGSWGVGKQVFLRSSGISTIFGLTVRDSDGSALLMGKTVLKSHYVDDNYYQDGYFGVPATEDQPLVMPDEDNASFDAFATLFGLQRGRSPGLSVVIPFPDPEITDEALIRAVLQDYFYPILAGQLEIFIETPSLQTVFDSNSILEEVGSLDPQIGGDLQPLVDLAVWAQTLSSEDHTHATQPNPSRAWHWSPDLFTTEQLKTLRADYQAGENLAVRVPVTVRKKDSDPLQSYFDVYLVRDSTAPGRPTFIREDLIISEITDAPRSRGVRSIVIAHDLAVAAFLRQSENPSHTMWDHARLKDTYERGFKTDLTFVKSSVHEIVRFLTDVDEEEDPTLLSDFFSIPAPPEEQEPTKTKHLTPKKKPGTATPPIAPPTPRPKRFRIQSLSGGFSILPGAEGAPAPDRLEITVGYDVRRGSPLKKYNKADFELDKEPIHFEPPPHNLEVIEQKENKLVVAIRNPEFSLHVKGFDERRQLYVRAIAREDDNGDS